MRRKCKRENLHLIIHFQDDCSRQVEASLPCGRRAPKLFPGRWQGAGLKVDHLTGSSLNCLPPDNISMQQATMPAPPSLHNLVPAL